MKRRRVILVSQIILSLAVTCSAQQKPTDVASSFLSPGTRLAELERFDPSTGKPTQAVSAVITGHFVSPDSNDIVFAQVNTSQDPRAKSLFITVLHKLPSGYTNVFEKSYYQRYLWVQDFTTVGLKVLRLPGELIDSILISTARGASLGAQTELYHWVDGLGMVNVMPNHPPAHQVSFILGNNQFTLKLSFQKYPGEKGVPHPISYRWDGHKLARADG
jgi:hypothetical protein